MLVLHKQGVRLATEAMVWSALEPLSFVVKRLHMVAELGC